MESMQALVVSAHSDRRATLAAVLRAAGVQVAAAENGTHGAVALSEPGIDVLVLDLRLNELDGGALRSALLAGERREGWRALVGGADGLQRFVALSAAPICPPP